MLAVHFLFGLACSGSHARPDAGSDNSCRGVQSGTVCSRLTDGIVLTCEAEAIVVEEPCPDGQLCLAGHCLSAGCKGAQSLRDGSGCSFYTAHADGVARDLLALRPTLLVLANPVRGLEAHAEVQAYLDGAWQPVETATIAPGTSVRLSVAVPAPHGAGTAARAGLRIISDEPVTALQIQDDDTDNMAATARGTTLLPTHMLGLQYRAAILPERGAAAVSELDPENGGAGLLVLVGTADDTMVSVTLPSKGEALTAPGVRSAGGTSFSLSLQEGDVYQLLSARKDADLGATVIASDKPLAVFSGNFATDYGTMPASSRSVFPDGIYEAMAPVENWASRWLVGWLAPRSACDSFFGTEPGAAYQILVMTGDSTAVVSLSSLTPGSADPSGGVIPPNSVAVYSIAKDDEKPILALVEVKAEGDTPIWVAQMLDCEPGMVPGLPLPLVLQSYVLGFPEGFHHRVAIVHGSGTPLTLDDRALPVPNKLLPSSPDYAVTYLDGSDLGECEHGAVSGCNHVIAGSAFGLSWRGAEATTSYGTSTVALPCQQGVEACF